MILGIGFLGHPLQRPHTAYGQETEYRSDLNPHEYVLSLMTPDDWSLTETVGMGEALNIHPHRLTKSVHSA